MTLEKVGIWVFNAFDCILGDRIFVCAFKMFGDYVIEKLGRANKNLPPRIQPNLFFLQYSSAKLGRRLCV